MGIPKATLPFGPEMMLTRVVRLLSEVVEPIVVAAAPNQPLPQLASDVIVTRDRREGRGPLEGLHAGLVAIQDRADAAFATSCDVPLLMSTFVRRMIELLGNHHIVVPKDGRFHHPLAAVYRTGVLPQLEALLDTGRLRPLFLFEQVDTREVPVSQLRNADPQLLTLENLNGPDDYLAALRRAGFEAPQAVLATLNTNSHGPNLKR